MEAVMVGKYRLRSLLWLGLIMPFAALAAGGASMGTTSSAAPLTPAEIAKRDYNSGISAVKQAKKYEESIAEATRPEKKATAQERTRKQYEKARAKFTDAVRRQPGMFEAWNYIGFTSRKLGEYDTALTAYDEALRLNPTYAEAIEYRGHAYLGLNRLEDAKAAYMSLFRDARPLAAQLMGAMQQWVADRRNDAAGVAVADREAFAGWVEERGAIASQTASLGSEGPAAHWD
jgi:tetratricopeptide (TPR) repeat protein